MNRAIIIISVVPLKGEKMSLLSQQNPTTPEPIFSPHTNLLCVMFKCHDPLANIVNNSLSIFDNANLIV